MLPKEYRLKKRKAFSATYKTGTSFHIDGITLFCGKKKDNNYPTKVGFVVSKKIHKRAVKRNRIKRLMRESYRLAIKNRKLSTKYMSIIFVASAKLLEKDFNFVNSAVNKLADKFREAIPNLQSLKILEDNSLSADGVIVETPDTRLDSRVSVQIAEIAAKMLTGSGDGLEQK